jgi:hypothetical protein
VASQLYRLTFDPRVTDAWFLDTPVPASGDEWAFWRLLRGESLSGDDLSPWKTRVKQSGRPLSFCFAGFDVPIVSGSVAKVLASDVPSAVQLLPLSLPEACEGYRILVATKSVHCIDEANSEFTTWGVSDGRPDKVGEYRMFSRLRLNPAAVPAGVHVFRVVGWRAALVVSAWLAAKLQGIVTEGITYEAVA